jgi:hypothetical protein
MCLGIVGVGGLSFCLEVRRRPPLSPKRRPVYKTNLTNRQQKRTFVCPEAKLLTFVEYAKVFVDFLKRFL